MAADGVLLIVAFFGPLEAAYRLQSDPQGWFIRGGLLGLGWLAVLRISFGKTTPA